MVYTWDNHGDPTNTPPPAVITSEDSQVSCGGSNSPSLSLSSGLDHEVVSGGSSSKTATGYRYKVVQNPGSTVTLKCSPSTSSTSTYGYAGVSLLYKWALQEVNVSLSGTTVISGVHYILTGQQVTASLVGATIAPNITPTWSLSTGADLCFGDFVVSSTTDNSTTPPTTITQGKGEVLPLQTNVVNFKFYTKKDGAVVAKCNAVIVLADNTTAALEAESKSITSKRPTAVWTINTGAVGFGLINGVDYLILGPYSTAMQGQDWYSNVTVPSPFSGGTSAWAQLIKPTRNTFVSPPQQGPPSISHNGAEGLDNAFPVAYFTTQVNGFFNSGDSPGQGLAGYKVTANDTARTWIMFLPPTAVSGQSTTWVPLSMYTWTWSATAELVSPPNGWAVTSATLPPAHPVASDSYDHPTWTFKHTNH